MLSEECGSIGHYPIFVANHDPASVLRVKLSLTDSKQHKPASCSAVNVNSESNIASVVR
jgi:hypothetical protein